MEIMDEAQIQTLTNEIENLTSDIENKESEMSNLQSEIDSIEAPEAPLDELNLTHLKMTERYDALKERLENMTELDPMFAKI